MPLVDRAIRDLGAPLFLALVATLFALVLRLGVARAVRAGLTVGAGFVAVKLVALLVVDPVGPIALAASRALGASFDTLDVGWPMAAAASLASPVVVLVVPAVIVLNVLLVRARVVRTLDVDLWNYWHFVYAGAIVHTATGSIVRGVAAGCVTAFVVLKLADWTAPAVEHHFGLPGIALPHTETVNWAPLFFALARVTGRRAQGERTETDTTTLRRRLAWLGEPVALGGMLGAIGGGLATLPQWRVHAYAAALRGLATFAVVVVAVLVVLPKAAAILSEGLAPLGESMRERLQARVTGREPLMGLDTAVVVGNPLNMAVALACVPIALVLACALPNNRMLPFVDLVALPFYVVWPVATARGNLRRAILHATVLVVLLLSIGTALAPVTTDLAHGVGLRGAPASGEALWSGLALGSHVVPWIVLLLFQPESPLFKWGIAAAVAYGAVWWWARREIRRRYSGASGQNVDGQRA